MRNKTLDDLVLYVYKRYPYPKSYWSKSHFEKRCAEIYASEQVILKCMDAPTKEPKEIIFDYIIVIEGCLRDATNCKTIQRLKNILYTLNTLYEYF